MNATARSIVEEFPFRANALLPSGKAMAPRRHVALGCGLVALPAAPFPGERVAGVKQIDPTAPRHLTGLVPVA